MIDVLDRLPDRGRACLNSLAQNETLRVMKQTQEELIFGWLQDVQVAFIADTNESDLNGEVMDANVFLEPIRRRFDEEIRLKTTHKQVTRVFAVEPLVRCLAQLTMFSGNMFRHSDIMTKTWIEKTVDTHVAVSAISSSFPIALSASGVNLTHRLISSIAPILVTSTAPRPRLRRYSDTAGLPQKSGDTIRSRSLLLEKKSAIRLLGMSTRRLPGQRDPRLLRDYQGSTLLIQMLWIASPPPYPIQRHRPKSLLKPSLI